MSPRLAPMLAFAAALLTAAPVAAQAGVEARWIETVEEVTVWFEEDEAPAEAGAVSRFLPVEPATGPSRAPLASLGPFHLTRPDTIEMIGTVDSDSPAQFAALLARHPGVKRLVMVECPGSVDEDANHALARSVRRAGLETIVPRGGSVRSGAVDLFLAGVRRSADAGSEFGVHSWRDEDGMEAADFPADAPVHAQYLAYYREMGLSDDDARRFYALTNSVPFDDVRMLSAADMARLGLAELSAGT